LICFHRLFGRDLVIYDAPQHFNESERVFREVDFSSEERDTRPVLLCVGDQLESVVGRAGAATKDADDQLRIVADQFGERLRAIVSNLEEKGPAAFGYACEGTYDVIVNKGRDICFGNARFNVGIENFEKISEPLSLRLQPKLVELAQRIVLGIEVIGERDE
jgi:hypothetical protein